MTRASEPVAGKRHGAPILSVPAWSVPAWSVPAWSIAAFATPILLAAACILFVRAAFGFQFPVPWPDETGFVAPAFDFARSGSFFDPGMNPDRTVMWMPPGYMVLLAAMFRIFGYSFALARWVSASSCLAALFCCATLARRMASGWRLAASGWVIAAAFLSPLMLIDANIARMEMVFAAIVLLAIAAIRAEKFAAAAALIAIAGLVHFNAVYFVPPLLAAVTIAALRGRLHRPRTADWFAMSAAALAWLAYGAHIAANWHGFQDDMAFQFALKRFVSINDTARPLWPVLAAASLAAAAALLRRLDAASMVALSGAAFVVMAHNGHELWYDYGQPLGFACIALAFLADGPKRPAPAAAWMRTTTAMNAAAAAAAAAAIFLTLLSAATVTDMLRPLLPHRAMITRNIVPASDIAKVRRFIATLQPGATVDFGWSGMELFFLADLARVGAHWSIIRHSVTQVVPFRKADWRIVCDSSEFPSYLFKFDIGHPRQGADSGCDIIRQ